LAWRRNLGFTVNSYSYVMRLCGYFEQF